MKGGSLGPQNGGGVVMRVSSPKWGGGFQWGGVPKSEGGGRWDPKMGGVVIRVPPPPPPR